MTHGEKTLKAVPFRKACPECQLYSSVFDHWDGILISQGSVKFQQHSALGIIPKIDKQVTMTQSMIELDSRHCYFWIQIFQYFR